MSDQSTEQQQPLTAPDLGGNRYSAVRMHDGSYTVVDAVTNASVMVHPHGDLTKRVPNRFSSEHDATLYANMRNREVERCGQDAANALLGRMGAAL